MREFGCSRRRFSARARLIFVFAGTTWRLISFSWPPKMIMGDFSRLVVGICFFFPRWSSHVKDLLTHFGRKLKRKPPLRFPDEVRPPEETRVRPLRLKRRLSPEARVGFSVALGVRLRTALRKPSPRLFSEDLEGTRRTISRIRRCAQHQIPRVRAFGCRSPGPLGVSCFLGSGGGSRPRFAQFTKTLAPDSDLGHFALDPQNGPQSTGNVDQPSCVLSVETHMHKAANGLHPKLIVAGIFGPKPIQKRAPSQKAIGLEV